MKKEKSREYPIFFQKKEKKFQTGERGDAKRAKGGGVILFESRLIKNILRPKREESAIFFMRFVFDLSQAYRVFDILCNKTCKREKSMI